jgi:hypothetical protein
LSWGYWKNHTSAWPSKTLELGGRTYSFSELTALLAMPVRGDASIELAHQLIAAKLNVLNGTNPATAKGAIDKADRLLSQYPGKLPYRVESSCSERDQMGDLAEALERFNSDGAAQPGCVVKK